MTQRARTRSAALRSGLSVRKGDDGWEVYDLDTGHLDSIHTTEGQARTWARQINERAGIGAARERPARKGRSWTLRRGNRGSEAEVARDRTSPEDIEQDIDKLVRETFWLATELQAGDDFPGRDGLVAMLSQSNRMLSCAGLILRHPGHWDALDLYRQQIAADYRKCDDA